MKINSDFITQTMSRAFIKDFKKLIALRDVLRDLYQFTIKIIIRRCLIHPKKIKKNYISNTIQKRDFKGT